MKKIIFVLFVLFLPISFARASISLTEVMYNPAGSDDKHEWVEVYNNGNDSVDLTKYFLQTDGAGSTYHSISSVNSTSFLGGGKYGIIAQDVPTFQADQPNCNCTVFDSSWSDLSDTIGKSIIINDPNKVALDQYLYDITLASNDGNSLQKNSRGTWVSALPTPGMPTLASINNTNSNNQNSSNTDANSVIDNVSIDTNITSTSTNKFSTKSPEAQLVIPRTAIAGVSINIIPSLVGVDNINPLSKSFHLSFGDGTEVYDYSPSLVKHTYDFPGTYVVYFEYLSNPYNRDESEKFYVKKIIEVLAPPVEISKVGLDGSVEIINSGSGEVDISGWILRSLSNPEKYFVIPLNTFILSGKKIIFSKNVTKLPIYDTKALELSVPSGNVVAVYDGNEETEINKSDNSVGQIFQNNNIQGIVNTQKVSTTKIQNKKTNITAQKISQLKSSTLSENDLKSDSVDVSSESLLPAQVVSNASYNKLGSSDNHTFLYVIFGIGLIGVIFVSIYTIKSLHNSDGGEYDKDEIRIVEE